MLLTTKVFLTGMMTLVSFLFITEMGNFSQCTPINFDKNMFSPEEIIMYVTIECGKSPIVILVFVGCYIFSTSFAAFSYYAFKWLNVPLGAWLATAVPGALAFIIEFAYHHLIIRSVGSLPLDNDLLGHYMNSISVACYVKNVFNTASIVLLVLSFLYKKNYLNGKPKTS